MHNIGAEVWRAHQSLCGNNCWLHSTSRARQNIRMIMLTRRRARDGWIEDVFRVEFWILWRRAHLWLQGINYQQYVKVNPPRFPMIVFGMWRLITALPMSPPRLIQGIGVIRATDFISDWPILMRAVLKCDSLMITDQAIRALQSNWRSMNAPKS